MKCSMSGRLVSARHFIQEAGTETGKAVSVQSKASTAPSTDAGISAVHHTNAKSPSPGFDLESPPSPENDAYSLEDPSLTITALGQNPPDMGKKGRCGQTSARSGWGFG